MKALLNKLIKHFVSYALKVYKAHFIATLPSYKLFHALVIYRPISGGIYRYFIGFIGRLFIDQYLEGISM